MADTVAEKLPPANNPSGEVMFARVEALRALVGGGSEPVEYHRGLLMFDRAHSAAVDDIASDAWRAHQAGKVALVQRRIEPGVCSYIAQPINHGA